MKTKSLYLIPFLICFLFFTCNNSKKNALESTNSKSTPIIDHKKMVWIPSGTFKMGASDDGEHYTEYPAHLVEVDGFWMDKTEVTNEEFKKFIDETGYITVAERPIDWEELKKQAPPGTPKPPDSILKPGTLVFKAPTIDNFSNDSQWWKWIIGANWKSPFGPESTIDSIMKHPVVHVSLEDALAYCEWAGKRLPTEAEWEFAARGGLEGKRFSWGDEDPVTNPLLANIWQGDFPTTNLEADGFAYTSPVGSFPPNGYGLLDMTGNVWEWVNDKYNENYYKRLASLPTCKNPLGATKSYDSRDPYAIKYINKGGSFLCHVSYCENYRPSARQSTTPDSAMSHLGFRTVSNE